MVTNVDGTGYDFETIDADAEDEGRRQYRGAQGFLRPAVAGHIVRRYAQALRRDPERMGNAYIEVMRDPQDQMVMFRRVDAKMMRLLRLDDAIPVAITVTRKGKE